MEYKINKKQVEIDWEIRELLVSKILMYYSEGEIAKELKMFVCPYLDEVSYLVSDFTLFEEWEIDNFKDALEKYNQIGLQ